MPYVRTHLDVPSKTLKDSEAVTNDEHKSRLRNEGFNMSRCKRATHKEAQMTKKLFWNGSKER